jgi:hypothetical protein
MAGDKTTALLSKNNFYQTYLMPFCARDLLPFFLVYINSIKKNTWLSATKVPYVQYMCMIGILQLLSPPPPPEVAAMGESPRDLAQAVSATNPVR